MPLNPFEREHVRNIAFHNQQISRLIDGAMNDIAFRFRTAKGKRFASIMKERLADLQDQILNNGKDAIRSQWLLSNRKNNKEIDGYLQSNLVTEEMYKSFRSPNLTALNAFLDRTHNGKTLNGRVWKITRTAGKEINDLIGQGVLEGKSAILIARDLKKYVKGKPILYKGKLIKGSNINFQAIRLAATEMNLAFRTSDYLQNSRLPFVTGVTVHLSPAHPRPDICFVAWNYKLLTPHGWKTLNKINIGDLVLTHKGRYRKVNKIYKSTTYEVDKTEMQFKNVYDSRAKTYKISATDNHPFMINGKWKAISEIQKGDKIKLLANKCKWCDKLIPFDRNYCSKSCASKEITKKQWSDDKHRKNVSLKAKIRCKGGIPYFKEWVESGENIKNLTNPETQAKLRIITKKRLAEQIKKGTHPFQQIETKRKGNQALARNKNNSFIERKIEWLLKEKGISHEHSYIFMRNETRSNGNGQQRRYYVIDFVIPEHKIAIECDGEYWHKDKDADKKRQIEIEKEGFTFLRFPGNQIRNDLKSCSEAIDRLMMNHEGEYEFMEIKVESVRHYTQKQKTPITKWNFGIEEDNSYVINGFFVHNCDEMEGGYPKGFHFGGWHPLCYSYDTEVYTNQGWK